MARLRIETIALLSIPLVFSIGITAFWLLVPSASQSLSTFIGYMSSLSTIIMVLIVVASNSLQREEMKNSRILQNQPLPSVSVSGISSLSKLTFSIDFPAKKACLERSLNYSLSMENIGNGPAVAIEVFPELTYFNEKKESLTIGYGKIKFALIKPGEKVELKGWFLNETGSFNDLSEGIMRPSLSTEPLCYGTAPRFSIIKLTIFFRNLLGATFREIAYFHVDISEESMPKVKDCLKAQKAMAIEHQENLNQLTNIVKTDPEKARELTKQLNAKLKDLDGCGEIELELESNYNNFSVTQRTEKDYKKMIAAYDKIDVLAKSFRYLKN
jgi:hypothetical protein